MQAIRSQSKLENLVTKALWRKGLRFRKNVRSLYGNPDIAIKKYKIVVFVDSCFWHGCPLHGNIPKTNSEYWENKLQRNKERDIEVTKYYQGNEWFIMRVWEHELKNNFENTVERIEQFIIDAKEYNKSGGDNGY